jgi:hypothetical protein
MVIAIAGQSCYSEGCPHKPAFTAPRRTPNGLEVVCACGDHNGDLEGEENLDTYVLRSICQAGSCDEPATHIVVDDELKPISTCKQHTGARL